MQRDLGLYDSNSNDTHNNIDNNSDVAKNITNNNAKKIRHDTTTATTTTTTTLSLDLRPLNLWNSFILLL